MFIKYQWFKFMNMVCYFIGHKYKGRQCSRCRHIYQDTYINRDDALYVRVGDFNMENVTQYKRYSILGSLLMIIAGYFIFDAIYYMHFWSGVIALFLMFFVGYYWNKDIEQKKKLKK